MAYLQTIKKVLSRADVSYSYFDTKPVSKCTKTVISFLTAVSCVSSKAQEVSSTFLQLVIIHQITYQNICESEFNRKVDPYKKKSNVEPFLFVKPI